MCRRDRHRRKGGTKNVPTQRFFNVKEEKRRAIVRAAVHEFSRVPYSVASINQIIKEAYISRGSCYT